MADKLTNGDYSLIPNTKELEQCDYIDEVLQNAALLLRAHRGKFYPNKDFGSMIAESPERATEYITAYASQALDLLDGVYVKSVDIVRNSANIHLIINDTNKGVIINLENNL